jgi:hypothetical protein
MACVFFINSALEIHYLVPFKSSRANHSCRAVLRLSSHNRGHIRGRDQDKAECTVQDRQTGSGKRNSWLIGQSKWLGQDKTGLKQATDIGRYYKMDIARQSNIRYIAGRFRSDKWRQVPVGWIKAGSTRSDIGRW